MQKRQRVRETEMIVLQKRERDRDDKLAKETEKQR